MTTSSLVVAGSLADNTSQISQNNQTVYSESLPHYWYRALHYILRIPFRELLGNVSRPYDPTAPLALADVPLNATIIDTHTRTALTNPYTGGRGSNSNITNNSNNNTNLPSTTTPQQSSITRSRHYFPQIRKAWGDRTSSMSWSISTAFFTSVICTVLALAALVLNWDVPNVYLKVFLIVFVIRKWTVTLLMADRALYRLPLNLTEPDPDVDEERHNGVAIYMSQLFTWHGYAMLFFGQVFVFYASGASLATYPIITGVALAFSCMGLVPFFALLSLLMCILFFLYFSYMVMYIVLWPLSYWGLVQRRAISRMNGGYQSEGITNTTDLNQIARSLEDAENGRGGSNGGGGFGGADHLRLTPAMMAIPIVVYKKPGRRPVMKTTPMAAGKQTQPQQQQQEVEQPVNIPPPCRIASPTPTPTRPPGDEPVHLTMPQPRPRVITTSRDTQNDALNRMSSNLSALYGTTPPSVAGGVANSSSGNGRSRASTVSMLSSNMSFVPCASGQEMAEVETRRRPISAIILPSQQPTPVGTGAVTPPAAADTGILYPTCLSTAAFPESHQRSYSSGQASNTTSHSRYSYGYTPSQHQQDSLSIHEFYLPVKVPSVLNSPQLHAIASLPAPRSLGTPTSSSFITSSAAPSSSSLPVLPLGSAAASVSEESSDHHQHSHPVHHQHQHQEADQALEVNDGDEECAICLSDFEDGDELRHLYCNHLFHRNCVDRWLVKSAFCPKCKRGI